MYKLTLTVPQGTRYLSQYTGFLGLLPKGHVIVNKGICNCGASTVWLKSNNPVVICSPRIAFLESKHEQHPDTHLFRPRKTRKRLELLKQNLKDYVAKCFHETQIDNKPFAPKVLVSYDSFPHVAEVLRELGALDQFDILVDEMQCLFTDSTFKATQEKVFLDSLKPCHNVYYLSATPYPDNYLDSLEPFNTMQYVQLDWSLNNIVIPSVKVEEVKSTYSAVIRKIEDFKRDGYFELITRNGITYYSNQMVCFCNSVKTIMNICKHFGFTPDDVNILCSENQEGHLNYTDKTRREVRFKVGKSPLKDEHHKTFTFATRASFEGVDFYHTMSSTYVIASPDKDSLRLDVSNDIIQIIGRQRRDDNPFQNEITIYFQSNRLPVPTKDEFDAIIASKSAETQMLINLYNSTVEPDQKRVMLKTLRQAQNSAKYKDNYICVKYNSLTGQEEVVFNDLVMAADIRSYEIQREHYRNGYSLIKVLSSVGVRASAVSSGDSEVDGFVKVFTIDRNKTRRMECYANFVEQHKDKRHIVDSLKLMPKTYGIYYERLGPVKLKSLCYRIDAIKDEIKFMDAKPKISAAALNEFVKGQKYSASEVKKKLQSIYLTLKLRHKAKANELNDYIPCKKVKDRDQLTGKRIDKYQIL